MNYKTINILMFVFLGSVLGCSNPANNPSEETANPSAEWELVWQDEFDGNSINAEHWNFELGASGWGNNEWQNYTARSQNAYISEGSLVIEARKENYQGSEYTSARMTTRNKGDWLYGRFEIRAKLPYGQGIWPAIWMLPTDWVYGGWAASGEIDIMEMVGHEPATVHGTLHYGGGWPDNVHTGSSFSLPQGRFADDYHVFTLEWEPAEMRWYVDGELYATQDEWYSTEAPYSAPFDKRFHMLLNIAVGGDWPGYPDGSTVFPQRMYVDYVRVYQREGNRPEVRFAENQESVFSDGSEVKLAVADHGSDVKSVAYFNGSKKIAEVNNAPFSYTWSNAPDGCFNIRARVKFDNDMTALSDILEIEVGNGCEQGPYGGESATLPGRIECEEYDTGGPDVAWFDSTPQENIGGAFRPNEGVDIEQCQDSGGGYNVGWAEAGEWLEYSVNVSETANYKLVMRCAAPTSSASFKVLAAGKELVAEKTIPASGGWQTWQDVESASFQLAAGSHVLRLQIVSGGANYNYFEVVKL